MTHDDLKSIAADAAALAAEWRAQSYRPGADRFEYCPETKSEHLCPTCQAIWWARVLIKETP